MVRMMLQTMRVHQLQFRLLLITPGLRRRLRDLVLIMTFIYKLREVSEWQQQD